MLVKAGLSLVTAVSGRTRPDTGVLGVERCLLEMLENKLQVKVISGGVPKEMPAPTLVRSLGRDQGETPVLRERPSSGPRDSWTGSWSTGRSGQEEALRKLIVTGEKSFTSGLNAIMKTLDLYFA